MQKTKTLIALPLLAGLLAAPLAASAENQPMKPASDSEFVTKIAQDGMLEVKLGKLAQQKAQNEDVKDFGEEMAEDHSTFNKQLAEAAEEAGLSVPQTMGDKGQMKYDRLAKMSGAAFDKAYMKDMVKGHTKVAAMLRSKQDNCDAEALCNVAGAGLPTIEDHLDEAKSIAQQIGGSTAGGSMNEDSSSM
jgi:putative membrane protein